MEDAYRQQVDVANDRAAQMNARQNQWPTTAAPQTFTQTPMPMPYTNPPIVVPGTGGPPAPTPAPMPDNPAADADAIAQAGTSGDSDFRTDLSEYHLVLVRDKDVPNTAGFDPRNKLKWFPRGRLPGSSETFYMVTHRFADKANINAEYRGDVVIQANSRGEPRCPLAVENAPMAKRDESATGTAMASPMNLPMSTWIAVMIISALLVYIVMKKSREETAAGRNRGSGMMPGNY